MTVKAEPQRIYILQLFITGASPRSAKAIANIKKICEERLDGHYELSVVDLYQQPAMASNEDIIAAPTLVKRLPLPLRKFIGDLSNSDSVLAGLGLGEREPDEGRTRR
jgi:circadian clock protein KaiB